jgi:hypothetical protein
MAKKLIMSCMAIVAFAAFVLPASAMALNDPQLTDGSGGAVAKGSLIKAHNVGETIFYNTAKTIKESVCNNVLLTGEVTSNGVGTGTVSGKITKANFAGTGPVHADNGLAECTGEIGNSYITVKNLPMEVSSTPAMVTDEFQVTGNAGAKIKFLIGSTLAGNCEYEAAGPVKGDYTTGTSATNDSTFKTRATEAGSGSKLIAGGFLCPSSGVLDMTFTMETDISETAGVWVS